MKRTPEEQNQWEFGAKNAKAGISLSQSYKHVDRYNHDLRNAHRDGWLAMKDYIKLKEIFDAD
jgi:hypothetical protein